MNRLQAVRELRGLSRAELADRVGVTTEAIRLLELDRRKPTLTTAYVICAVLDASVEEIWPVPDHVDTPAPQAT